MNKIVSFLYVNVISKKICVALPRNFLLPPQSQSRSYGLGSMADQGFMERDKLTINEITQVYL